MGLGHILSSVDSNGMGNVAQEFGGFPIPRPTAFGNQWFEADPLASAKRGGVQVIHLDLCTGQGGSRCRPACFC